MSCKCDEGCLEINRFVSKRALYIERYSLDACSYYSGLMNTYGRLELEYARALLKDQ